jgi:hypothetical protein
LSKRKNEDRTESAGEEPEDTSAYVAGHRLTDMFAEEGAPVRFMPTLRFGECKEDLAFLSGPPTREVAIHGGFGPFVGKIASPTLDVSRVGVRPRVRNCRHRISSRSAGEVAHSLAAFPHIPAQIRIYRTHMSAGRRNEP